MHNRIGLWELRCVTTQGQTRELERERVVSLGIVLFYEATYTVPDSGIEKKIPELRKKFV